VNSTLIIISSKVIRVQIGVAVDRVPRDAVLVLLPVSAHEVVRHLILLGCHLLARCLRWQVVARLLLAVGLEFVVEGLELVRLLELVSLNVHHLLRLLAALEIPKCLLLLTERDFRGKAVVRVFKTHLLHH